MSRRMRFRFTFFDAEGLEVGRDIMPSLRGLRAVVRDDLPEGAFVKVTSLEDGRLVRVYGLLNGECLRLGPH